MASLLRAFKMFTFVYPPYVLWMIKEAQDNARGGSDDDE